MFSGLCEHLLQLLVLTGQLLLSPVLDADSALEDPILLLALHPRCLVLREEYLVVLQGGAQGQYCGLALISGRLVLRPYGRSNALLIVTREVDTGQFLFLV